MTYFILSFSQEKFVVEIAVLDLYKVHNPKKIPLDPLAGGAYARFRFAQTVHGTGAQLVAKVKGWRCLAQEKFDPSDLRRKQNMDSILAQIP